MLILVRKVQQGIWIGDDILIKILDVERDRVKLGIQAPDTVRVVRQELVDRDVSDAELEVEEST
jgi:carbon storage regulator